MPAADLALLEQAAHEAGRIALRYWRQAPQVWDKPAGAGPVTEADLAVNRHLESLLRAARPDYGWLSEESADDPARLAAEYCFIVDPIDGTRAFIDGQEGFSHSLAVTRRGEVVAAVVHLPAQEITYSADATGPALCNGASLRPSDHRQLVGAQVLTGKPSLDPVHWRGRTPPVRRGFRPSLAWRLCLVAEGRFDAALTTRPAWEWDVAAGCLIAARAGCAVTDLAGQPPRFNSPQALTDGLVVAPPTLHDRIMAAMTPRPPRLDTRDHHG
ncbi:MULTISPECIES: 3'(2'),5'-bisphosphate nucleotidase CysQ [unclassified Paracoccus (in: a-proteobacteria)]|uniref:3'(2'),5'-bisphosphate nucleotidase CysQ n=1 Tax=unclassified Paracoccus (in: a-proteobacteria) TaxID=2688777 RepID=UPI0012B248C0|nr:MULTISPECIES: 3'(2'),5'-bisphosphate nucleotidase CysQ [unclassified Paracoccus (in: a-proteobacteria)]UXU75851.1 3'(2'),5'-bisphosphate nucleotidase CysQ [Paracoccus sp. SMMA_5]UXU81760.1 3'(2'),5'-bisphosphate nucleotidase CysQ [Paracoccus sp. SMMA_5_TC]